MIPRGELRGKFANFVRSEYDQELDSLLVGPIPVGVNKFIFEADPPDLKRIPDSDILGVTVILLTCSYDGREFVRVGYYVNNEYDNEEMRAEPPAKPIIERINRNILAEKPRVTRFAIKWYVLVLLFSYVSSFFLTLLGIPRSLPQLNTHQTNPKPTTWKTTAMPMVLKKPNSKQLWSKNSTRLKSRSNNPKPSPRVRIMKWKVPSLLLVRRKTFLMVKAKISRMKVTMRRKNLRRKRVVKKMLKWAMTRNTKRHPGLSTSRPTLWFTKSLYDMVWIGVGKFCLRSIFSF